MENLRLGPGFRKQIAQMEKENGLLEVHLEVYERLEPNIIGQLFPLSKKWTFSNKVRQEISDRECVIMALKDWVKQLENEKDN